MSAKNTFKLFMLAILSGHLLACQGSGGNTSPTPTTGGSEAQEVNPRRVLAEGVVIEVKKVADLREDRSNYSEFKNNLNIYETKLSIPESLYVNQLEIKRSFSSLAVNPAYESISKIDAKYVSGQYVISDRLDLWKNDHAQKTVTYRIYSKEKLIAESTYTLLPDLLVSSESKVTTLQSLGISSGAYKFGIIFIEKDNVLRTEGQEVYLEAGRLYAEDTATIETFSAEEAEKIPAPGQVGKNGGYLSLKAGYAMGDLKLHMRGTAGGEGLPAAAQTGIGAKGARGVDATSRRMCEPGGGVFLMAPELRRGATFCEIICTRQPTNGGAGAQGPKGLRGGMGMIGGHSGAADIVIAKGPYFTASLSAEAGLGGLGGAGSEGGKGGEGGDPGSTRGDCRTASKGPQGALGEKGDMGSSGPRGVEERSSITVDGHSIL
ncbi:hypothetical protein EZJ49_12515 [Bdellovibrio bacteriovorus]|uniref:hypothetical protein n=1 Tax=Bdellovibrio bacteriovorus TaxID=959 RepID=UPI0021D3611F|nr:hypothetical protein [Bdellovibrio bacteriovorus]UXR63887.1 hypothetical protein EZJ49_12515 [Bdellovibrio bacteriovorus]